MNATTGSVTTAGSTCTVCGTFVLNGYWHSCGGTPRAGWRPCEQAVVNRDQEIIDRLDQIIKLLQQAAK